MDIKRYKHINSNRVPFVQFTKKYDKIFREKRKEWYSTSPTPECHLVALRELYNLDINFEEYKSDPYLAEFLKDKSVVIVGPSPHILDYNFGTQIDEFDVVARIHQYDSIKNQKQLGSKGDILFSCANSPSIDVMLDNRDYIETYKFVIASNVGLWSAPARERLLKTYLDTNIHQINDSYMMKLSSEVNTMCNTGIYAIHSLLHYDIKSLYILGFSFYKDNKIYNKEHIKTSNRLRLDIQNQDCQLSFLKKLLENDSRIVCDPFLEGLVSEF